MEPVEINSFSWQKITARKTYIGKLIGSYSAYYGKNRGSLTITVVKEDPVYGSIQGVWNFNQKVDDPNNVSEKELKNIKKICLREIAKLEEE